MIAEKDGRRLLAHPGYLLARFARFTSIAALCAPSAVFVAIPRLLPAVLVSYVGTLLRAGSAVSHSSNSFLDRITCQAQYIVLTPECNPISSIYPANEDPNLSTTRNRFPVDMPKCALGRGSCGLEVETAQIDKPLVSPAEQALGTHDEWSSASSPWRTTASDGSGAGHLGR